MHLKFLFFNTFIVKGGNSKLRKRNTCIAHINIYLLIICLCQKIYTCNNIILNFFFQYEMKYTLLIFLHGNLCRFCIGEEFMFEFARVPSHIDFIMYQFDDQFTNTS